MAISRTLSLAVETTTCSGGQPRQHGRQASLRVSERGSSGSVARAGRGCCARVCVTVLVLLGEAVRASARWQGYTSPGLLRVRAGSWPGQPS